MNDGIATIDLGDLTLTYIYDVPRALRTVQRILRPGGVFLASDQRYQMVVAGRAVKRCRAPPDAR